MTDVINWQALAERVVAGVSLSDAEALRVLTAVDDELLSLLDAAFFVRRRYFGRGVRVHVLCNAKAGHCAEDCAFCSQSGAAQSGIESHPLQSVEALVAAARAAQGVGAFRYCIVLAGRRPARQDLAVITEAARQIKREVALELCVSPGLVDAAQAQALKAAGVDRINHNLETSRRYFPSICTTHTWDDRLATLRVARQAGLQLCCGGIIGLGETLADRVALALALRDLAPESIPVNLFNPRPGTRLAHLPLPSPQECLRALCLFRLTNPRSEIRIAGGREVCLRALQALALYPANSLFSNGYLTTPGAGLAADRQLIADAGFVIESYPEGQP